MRNLLLLVLLVVGCQPVPTYQLDSYDVEFYWPDATRGISAAERFGARFERQYESDRSDVRLLNADRSCRDGLVIRAVPGERTVTIDAECCRRTASVAFCVAHALGHWLTTTKHACFLPEAAARDFIDSCDTRYSARGPRLMDHGPETPGEFIDRGLITVEPTEHDLRLTELVTHDCYDTIGGPRCRSYR